MMNIKRLVLSSAVCLVAAGCEKVADYLPMFKEKQAIEKAVAEASPSDVEPAAEQRVSVEMQTFMHHVEANAKILAGELEAVIRRVTEIRTDSEAFAKVMAVAAGRKSEDGRSVGRKEALVSLLKDDSVNALARRYLKRSFSMLALEVEERVGEAEEAERRQRRELDANADAAKATVEAAKAEDRRARMMVLEGEKRLKRELEALRRRKKKLENELNMIAATDRNTKRQEIRDVDSEIRRREREYDGLRTSSVVNRELQRSEEQVRNAKFSADSLRVMADARIGKAGKVISPGNVVAEYEQRTVIALEKAIADALSSAEARKKRISRVTEYVKSSLGVDQNMATSALQGIKTEIDARIAAALKDSD